MVVRFFIDLNDYASRVRSLKEITSIVANIVAQRDDLIIDITVQTISVEKYISLFHIARC